MTVIYETTLLFWGHLNFKDSYRIWRETDEKRKHVRGFASGALLPDFISGLTFASPVNQLSLKGIGLVYPLIFSCFLFMGILLAQSNKIERMLSWESRTWAGREAPSLLGDQTDTERAKTVVIKLFSGTLSCEILSIVLNIWPNGPFHRFHRCK